MEYAFRTDSGTLRPVRRLDGGRIICDVFMARSGIYEYSDPKYPGGIRRELRRDSEVFSPKAMASYALMPATPVHPPKLLDTTTAKIWSIGATDSVVKRERIDGQDWVRGQVMVTDQKTIDRMDAGDTAVSMGYACLIMPKGGVDPVYGRFDVEQLEITGNHLAVAIGEGRAGLIARARMDSEITPRERAEAKARGDDIATIADLIFATSMSVFTSSEEGHQHSFDPTMLGGCTSYASTAGDPPNNHNHEWIRGADGKIVISENAGHTHTADMTTVGARSDTSATGAMVAPSRFDSRGGNMADENEKERLQQNAAALEAELRATKLKLTETVTRADTAEKQRDVITGQLDQVTKELGEIRVQLASGQTAIETAAIKERQDKIDVLEQKVSRFDESLAGRIKSRTALMFKAGSVMGTDFRMDDLTDRQIMCAVVQRLDATADVSDKVPEGNIQGQFDQLFKRRLSRARQEANIVATLGTEAQQSRADVKDTKMEDYRKRGSRPLSDVLHNNNRNRKGA